MSDTSAADEVGARLFFLKLQNFRKITGNSSRDYGYQRKRRKRAKNKARKRESIQKKIKP